MESKVEMEAKGNEPESGTEETAIINLLKKAFFSSFKLKVGTKPEIALQ